ncbi:hypothetical protein HMPREF9296_0105 [Prevotella disiens FB035-09AN]|uniref:Uncharacterized protein n=1 Tax=Prevotella disiens FB035-09AN TaxID=866771 RepID=E1KRR3_9BACT|nr:hypothetical protein HMPREF9296_0105 [Prevotella disiens FB035-09AN]
MIFFSWGLLAPKPLGVFRYRLLSYTSTWDCSSMLNLRIFNYKTYWKISLEIYFSITKK